MAEVVHACSDAVGGTVNVAALVGHQPRAYGTGAPVLHDQDRHCLLLVVAADEGVVERHLWDRIRVQLDGPVGRVVAAAGHALLAPAAVREVRGLMRVVLGAGGGTGVAGWLGLPRFFRRVLFLDLVAVLGRRVLDLFN